MISLTSKADFYENSFDLLKSIANPNQLLIRYFNALSREMKLLKSTVFQHLASLKKEEHDFRNTQQQKCR